jgi:protein-disulfide isomerase
MNAQRSRRKAVRSAAAFAWLLSTSGLALAEDAKEVLAKVGDHAITEADIAEDIAGQMVRINNQIYSTKKQAIDSAIAEYLVDQEAKKRGVTREQLLKQEVTDKTPAVADAEVQQVYDANKARLGGKTLEEIKPQIVQQLQANKQQQQQQTFIQELRKTANIKMLIKPPVLQVSTDGAPVRGASNAPVTIVEFSDFQCPYCARVQGELVKVRDTYKDKVKIVYKDFPLSIHNNAQKAAEAARCALDQDKDKYWEYHDKLFANGTALGVDNLKKFAVDLKFDSAKFNECLDSGKHAVAVNKDMTDGTKIGVSGTPAFLINGRFLSGAQPFSAFQEAIDDALTATN